jgi:hypothetical protein
VRLDHQVDVLGDVVDGAVQHAGHTADRDVGDAVAVEDLDDASQIERRTLVVSHDAICASRRETSTHGSSPVRGGNVGYNETQCVGVVAGHCGDPATELGLANLGDETIDLRSDSRCYRDRHSGATSATKSTLQEDRLGTLGPARRDRSAQKSISMPTLNRSLALRCDGFDERRDVGVAGL